MLGSCWPNWEWLFSRSHLGLEIGGGLLALAKFDFDVSERFLKLFFAQFWVKILDVFDGGKLISTAAVLRRLEGFDQDGFKRGDD